MTSYWLAWSLMIMLSPMGVLRVYKKLTSCLAIILWLIMPSYNTQINNVHTLDYVIKLL